MPTALVDALDLVVARHAAGALPGDRRAAGMGAGTELAQLRPYEIGDDVRQIDAAATARTGEPHVRLHVPERTLTTWIVLDVSPSMAFGTAQRLKADVAEGVALVLGNLAVRRAGRVAMMTFGAGRPHLVPPRGSRPGVVALRRVLAEGVAPDGVNEPHALAHALGRVGRVARHDEVERVDQRRGHAAGPLPGGGRSEDRVAHAAATRRCERLTWSASGSVTSASTRSRRSSALTPSLSAS